MIYVNHYYLCITYESIGLLTPPIDFLSDCICNCLLTIVCDVDLCQSTVLVLLQEMVEGLKPSIKQTIVNIYTI